MRISTLLCFTFWIPIYFLHEDPAFSSDFPEERSRFVSLSETSVHAITFKMLKNNFQKVIYWSNDFLGDKILQATFMLTLQLKLQLLSLDKRSL